jgi:hypothetical protein
MQEFVLVTFVENRRVFVGGQHMGFTNRVFTVTTGVHTVFLDDPRDYGPSSITELVRFTRQDDPFIFNFVKSTHVQEVLARARLEDETGEV